MGYGSNELLNQGRGRRKASHRLVRVAITTVPPDSWSEDCKVVVEIIATREDGAYSAFYLERPEAEKCAEMILRECPGNVRERLAVQALKGMTATKLLKALSSILRARLRDEPSPAGG